MLNAGQCHSTVNAGVCLILDMYGPERYVIFGSLNEHHQLLQQRRYWWEVFPIGTRVMPIPIQVFPIPIPRIGSISLCHSHHPHGIPVGFPLFNGNSIPRSSLPQTTRSHSPLNLYKTQDGVMGRLFPLLVTDKYASTPPSQNVCPRLCQDRLIGLFMTLTFDLWPRNPFHKCQLARFSEIPSLSTEITCRAK